MIFCLGTKGLHFSISALLYAVFLTDIVYFSRLQIEFPVVS